MVLETRPKLAILISSYLEFRIEKKTHFYHKNIFDISNVLIVKEVGVFDDDLINHIIIL